jgi:hypothetical protein
MTTTPSESSTEELEGGERGGEGEEGEEEEEEEEEEGLLMGSSYEVARVIKDTVAKSPLASPASASVVGARAVEEAGVAVDDSLGSSLGTIPLFGGGMRVGGALFGFCFSSSATRGGEVGERRGGGR